ATCFTSASSEPTTAWMLAVVDLVFVFGIGDFIAWRSIDYKIVERIPHVGRTRHSVRAASVNGVQTTARSTNRFSLLHARATAPRVARVFYRPSLRFNFRQSGPAFYFHNLVAQ